MKKVYLFLADGFETVEALAPVDVMRRAGIEVVTVSIMKRAEVISAQGVTVVADALYEDVSFDDASALVYFYQEFGRKAGSVQEAVDWYEDENKEQSTSGQ